jgi:hypothetical protein
VLTARRSDTTVAPPRPAAAPERTDRVGANRHPAPPTGRRDGWSLLAVAVALATVVAVPLRAAALALRERAVPSMPDLHETLLAAMAARHLDQLVGAWSRLGLYHPGPLWFYWAAPFVAASGDQPAGLVAAALVLVAACAATTCVAVGRAAGGVEAVVAAAVVLLAVHQLSLEGLSYPWNPTVLILPVAAGLVVAATCWVQPSLAWPVVGAWLGAFAVQAHLGAMLVGGFVIAASIAGSARTRRAGGTTTPWWAWALVATLVAAPWVPVAVDQVRGTGNLGATARYAATGDIDPRFTPEEPTATLDLGPGEVVARVAALTTLTESEVAEWGGAEFRRGLDRGPNPTSPLVLVGLLGAAAAGALPGRLRRWRSGPADDLATWVCRLALVATAAQLVTAFRGRHEFRSYLVAGSSGVGIALWLGVALTAVAVVRTLAARRGLDRRRLRLAGLAGTVALAVAVGSSTSTDLEAAAGPPMRPHPTVATLRDLAPTGTFLVVADDSAELTAVQELVEELERQGRRVAVRGRHVARFADRQREATPTGPEVRLVGEAEVAPSCSPAGSFAGLVACLQR